MIGEEEVKGGQKSRFDCTRSCRRIQKLLAGFCTHSDYTGETNKQSQKNECLLYHSSRLCASAGPLMELHRACSLLECSASIAKLLLPMPR